MAIFLSNTELRIALGSSSSCKKGSLGNSCAAILRVDRTSLLNTPKDSPIECKNRDLMYDGSNKESKMVVSEIIELSDKPTQINRQSQFLSKATLGEEIIERKSLMASQYCKTTHLLKIQLSPPIQPNNYEYLPDPSTITDVNSKECFHKKKLSKGCESIMELQDIDFQYDIDMQISSISKVNQSSVLDDDFDKDFYIGNNPTFQEDESRFKLERVSMNRNPNIDKINRDNERRFNLTKGVSNSKRESSSKLNLLEAANLKKELILSTKLGSHASKLQTAKK